MIPSIGSSGPHGSRGASAADDIAKTQTAGRKNPASKASEEGDRVTLSASARDIQTLRAHLGDDAAARAAKVAELKERVRQGTYRIDSDTLASRIRDAWSS